ncbi:NFX1-type zinc finger-containing protein 1 [Podila horticola]|nr:NFX1-type zinc finger-containing protein 1 [Podila horticola]
MGLKETIIAKNLKGAEVATDLMTGSSPGGLMSRQPLGIKALAHGMATSQDSNITGVQITEEVRHVMLTNAGGNKGRGGKQQSGGRGNNRRFVPPREERNPYTGLAPPRPLVDESWKRSLPKDNFRFQTISPTEADINSDSYPDPPEHITHRPYDSTEQYLETQFRLLRADCTLPVRGTVRAYRDGVVEDNEMTMYTNVRPVALLFASVGLIHRMSFRVDGRRVNWKQSKRLIPGTIVCLSTNHFETYRFATVVERDMEFLQNPRNLRIGIKFLELDSSKDFDSDICYTMIESMQGYFEAYQHVLRCIQNINPETLPFQPQLVDLDPMLERPFYNKHTNTLTDDAFVAKSLSDFVWTLKEDEHKDKGKPQKTGDDSAHPVVLEAMNRLLTKELAVVQGPPGTGKTFLGLLTTKILLQELKPASTGPIIVVCQTNHALDQFLENAMKFEERVIRIGSRSKNEVVMSRTLYNIRQKYRESPNEARAYGVQLASPVRYYRLKDKLETDMLALLEEMAVDYISLAKLLELGIIDKDQFESFSTEEWVTSAQEEEDSTVESWLKAAPMIMNHHDISIYDDANLKDDIVPEIDAEELEEQIQEYMVGNIDEAKVTGNAVNVKPSIVCHLDVELMGDVKDFLSMRNVYDIPGEKRMGVYKIWQQRYRTTINEKLGELNRLFNIVCDNIRSELRKNDAQILKTARIIGMTTTAASKYHDLLSILQPRVMICEEASETMEAHLLAALTPSVQHFILIGDHEQLRPSMSVDDLKNKGIDISMFERLVQNNFPYSVLRCQRRMRPEIRKLVRPIYKDLTDHESVRKYDNVRGFVHNLWFLTHDEPETLESTNSFVNPHEASMIARLAVYILQQGYPPSQITILTMYSGQRNLIMDKLRRVAHDDARNIRVCTVDGFQGEENEIILLSLVRSNSNNSIGFLKTSNRVCVGLSRAKKGLYIFGNGKLLMEQSKLWESIIWSLLPPDPNNKRLGNQIHLRCQNHPDTVSQVGLEADFERVEYGGCHKPCDGRMEPCGHPCVFPCHTSSHDEMRCNAACAKKLSCGQHFCQNSCSDMCRPCDICEGGESGGGGGRDPWKF